MGMRSFRQFSKVLYLGLFLSMGLCLFFKWMSLSLITLVALFAFLTEFSYYFLEKMSNVVLIPIGDLIQNRRKSAGILVVSVRIYSQGFEYGYWNTYVSWNKIINFKRIAGGNSVLMEKSGLFYNKFSIEFNKTSDVIEFENYLRTSNKSIA